MSVCPSVRLFDTSQFYPRPAEIETSGSRHNSIESIVFRVKILCRWVKGISRTRRRTRGTPTPLKRRYSIASDSSNVKMVANRHRHAAYYNKHWRRLLRNANIDNIEWSQTFKTSMTLNPKKGFSSDFLVTFSWFFAASSELQQNGLR